MPTENRSGQTEGDDGGSGSTTVTSPPGSKRLWQLVAAAAMMAAVSPYQYVWSSIEGPLSADLGVALPALGLVFSLYVVFQALSQFPAGWWRDRSGPAGVSYLAALLAGGGYVGVSYATGIWQLYLLYSLGSIGVGVVYTVAVNTAVKWYPDRSGLATGVSTMAFAAGSVLVVPYVRANATPEAYGAVLRHVGVGMFLVLAVGAYVLRDPTEDEREELESREAVSEDVAEADDDGAASEGGARRAGAARVFSTSEILRTWQFWVMYMMFVCIAGADLLVIANVVGFAEQFGFAAVVATASATLLPLASGSSRILLGEVSDRYGRTRVMAASFVLAGVFRFALVYTGVAGHRVAFVAMVLAAMFFSSPLYVYFPSLLSDYYGARYSSGNYAVLYTAKIGGGVFAGTVAGFLITGVGWNATFVVGGVAAVVAGVGALVLRAPGEQEQDV